MSRRLFFSKRAGLVLGAVIFLFGGLGIGEAKPAPKNGVVQEHYPNGRLRLETRYKNERLLRYRTFYRNGRTHLDIQYKRGVPVQMRTFYDNGRLKSRWQRKTQKTDYYDRNGRLKASVTTAVDDINRLIR